MNKAWYFGDSFTYGYGCRPGEHFYEQYPELRASTWTEILSTKLQVEEVNKGTPGNSCQVILSEIIQNLSNFKKGDYVFLTDTSPIRLPLPTCSGKELKSFTPELLVWPRLQDKEFAENFFNLFFKTDKDQEILVDFIHSFYFEHYELWSKFYMDQLNSIAQFLNSQEIYTYTWSWKIWHNSNKYTDIKTATKGKIKDTHWDWQGHKGFANYLLKRIDNKEYIYKKDII